jgi:hypothetical protein
MNVKLIASFVIAIALIATIAPISAHNIGDRGVAYPGVPCVTPISGGDCVEVYTAHSTLEAATLGLEGFDDTAAYAGRPYIGSKY